MLIRLPLLPLLRAFFCLLLLTLTRTTYSQKAKNHFGCINKNIPFKQTPLVKDNFFVENHIIDSITLSPAVIEFRHYIFTSTTTYGYVIVVQSDLSKSWVSRTDYFVGTLSP